MVSSRWNDFLTSRLVEGALDALERLGADEGSVEHFRVPGSFEIPLLAHRLAKTGKFDAVVCLGTVIRGQTPHFEYVAGEVTKGIAQAAIESGVPVLYGIVTADIAASNPLFPALTPARSMACSRVSAVTMP